ncbi:hypothetical protein EDD17DRAFT_1673976 [Pisolithus thermaeus]|nr:hypothetical protein EV401DRAFT_1966016 [Pisolithus croceorrhizus]KAI6138425.1 hypothetical protein EDD17DRAFT_1673976 [Pisolithus thermaeus]
MYDYALTFGREVDLFWCQPRRTWAFALFIANRYIGLFGRIPAFMVNFLADSGGSNSPVCQNLHMCDQIIMAILQFIGSVIMMMRVYAFYDQDRRVLALFIIVALISAGVCCWAFLFRGPLLPPPKYMVLVGCLGPIYPSQAPRYAAAWGGQLLLDALVFAFTLWKLMRIDKMGERTFLDMLLRDGAMYFAVMTVMNVANITMFLVADPYVKSVLSSPTNLLCAAMISRLMMNLRDPKIRGQTIVVVSAGQEFTNEPWSPATYSEVHRNA